MRWMDGDEASSTFTFKQQDIRTMFRLEHQSIKK